MLLVLGAGGCSSRSIDDAPTADRGVTESPTSEDASSEQAVPDPGGTSASDRDKIAAVDITPPMFELDAEQLLAMRLPEDQRRDGWIRLFDGHTLYGWQMAGAANWRIEDQQLSVDAGNASLLCTSLDWLDYELQLEFKADADTNSGIFLRTPLFPDDPATDCYELNIAPKENPFPTGSLVGRRKLEPAALGDFDSDRWHTYHVRVEGDTVSIRLDDVELYSWTDPMPRPAGRIALQHNEGRIAFRNILLRPLGLRPLLPELAGEDAPDEEASEAQEPPSADALALWQRYPDMAGRFEMDDDGNLHVRGGPGQLETRAEFGDFVLTAEVKTAGPEQNSGIFFRCIPGDQMMGYECQINNDTIDGNPLRPADAGTGAIFRRQEARIVAADNDEWFSLLLVAHGPDMAAWVNGLQVSEWRDTREPDPNPRRGQRLDAGTIILQAHDPSTDVRFRSLRIAETNK